MKSRRSFIPPAIVELEERLVLSQAGRGLSVVVSGLHPRAQVLSHRRQPVVAEVNQAFDSFKSDYGQARAAYYASIRDQTPASPVTKDAAKAFTLYTVQRVSLLAQQVISSFLQSAAATARAKGQPETLRQLVSLKIINTRAVDKAGVPGGALVQSLVGAIPSAGASPSTQSLYTLSQDNAIESARVAVINGVNIVRNGDFGNRSRSHH